MADFTPTDEQRAILDHDHGQHARILAGPGTGKSATVVAWLDDLLSSEKPPRARLLTFTRAATGELAEKVSDHPHASTLRPSTIHSFAISTLLANEGVADFPSPLRLADDWENTHIVIQSLAKRLNLRANQVKKLFVELAAGWEALNGGFENQDIDDDLRRRFRSGWLEHRRVYGYTLLGELPYALRRALINHDDLQGTDYDLLIVDEYQDLNPCDLDLLRLMAERGCRIVAVGDDDQSIYSFRQADPEGIQLFCEEFNGSADYPLSITHRCGQSVINWATSVIEGDLSRDLNRSRLTPAEGSPPGQVALLRFGGHRAEARGIANLVQHLITNKGVHPNKILILFRSDYQGSFSNILKEELDNVEIVYSDPDAVKSILASPQIRKLLARLRLLENPSDSLAWATLVELFRGLGDTFRQNIYERASSQGCQFGEALLQSHEDGFDTLTGALQTRATNLVTKTRTWIDNHDLPVSAPENGWGEWIVRLAVTEDNGLAEEMKEILIEVDESSGSDQSLSQYLNQLAPLAKDRAQTENEGVRIMSMAASKGLTVDAVILPALEEGIIPRDGANLDEERRLLYVAMTRAKQYLFGTWATRRRGPTARAGGRSVGRRTYSSFLAEGPVEPTDGTTFLQELQ